MMHTTLKVMLITMLFVIHQIANCQTLDWSEKANPLMNSINGVAFNSSGDEVISGTNCHPASIRLFETSNGNLNWDYEVGSDFLCIMGVAISANKSYIAAIEEYGNILIFDNTGLLPIIIDTIKTGTDYGFSVAISPDNSTLLVGCSDGKMMGYQIETGELIFDINAHSSWVTTVAYSPDGAYIISGGNDDKVKIWQSNGVLIYTCSGHIGDITCVKVSPDNQFVVSSSKDDLIKIWDIETGVEIRTLNGHENNVNGVDISPDSKYIVSVSTDATNKIWQLSTGNLLSTFGLIDCGAVNAVAWSPAGDKIVTGNAKSDVMLWSVDMLVLPVHELTQSNIKIYPNPTSDFLQFEIDKTFAFDKIIVLDSIGKKVLSVPATTKLDIRELSSGIYLVYLMSNNAIMAQQKITIIK